MATFDVFLSTKADAPGRMFLLGWTLAGWAPYVRAGIARLHVQDFGCKTDAFAAIFQGNYQWAACRELGDALRGITFERYPVEGSQRLRHVLAAERATTPIYALVDDDIRPMPRLHVQDNGCATPPWPQHVADQFAAHPSIAMLAPIPSPGGLDPHVCDAFLERASASIDADERAAIRRALRIPSPDPDLWFTSSVGGIRFVRRGIVDASCPPLDPAMGGGYDITLATWLRTKGFDVAYLHRWGAVHAGYEDSEVWRAT